VNINFVDGMNLMALIVAIVYSITAWQSRRCSTNVNEFNNLISALIIRQTILAEKSGVEIPHIDDVIQQMGRPLPGAPPSWASHSCRRNKTTAIQSREESCPT